MNKYTLAAVGILIICVLGYVLSSLLFSSEEVIKNYPSTGSDVIAFGDSLVVGVGSTEGNDFVSLLSGQLGVPIINLGKSGDTTRSALLRLDEVLEYDPKIVLLLLGGNDYLRRISKEETFANLGTMIQSIQDTGSIVVLLGVRGGALRDSYQSNYKALAKQYQTAYVPNVLDDLIGKPDLMYDTIHPNDAGYKIIANRVYPVVKELMN